jgi:hypothetical protein
MSCSGADLGILHMEDSFKPNHSMVQTNTKLRFGTDISSTPDETVILVSACSPHRSNWLDTLVYLTVGFV